MHAHSSPYARVYALLRGDVALPKGDSVVVGELLTRHFWYNCVEREKEHGFTSPSDGYPGRWLAILSLHLLARSRAHSRHSLLHMRVHGW